MDGYPHHEHQRRVWSSYAHISTRQSVESCVFLQSVFCTFVFFYAFLCISCQFTLFLSYLSSCVHICDKHACSTMAQDEQSVTVFTITRGLNLIKAITGLLVNLKPINHKLFVLFWCLPNPLADRQEMVVPTRETCVTDALECFFKHKTNIKAALLYVHILKRFLLYIILKQSLHCV